MSDALTPSNAHLEDSFGFLLKQAFVTLQRAVDNEMIQLDLTAMQWRPLLLLALGKVETAADIARLACTDTGAVTRMLDRLEAKGLVRRVRSNEDRRIVRLELTEDGEVAARRIPELLDKVHRDHTSGFSEDEIALFKTYLRRVIANPNQPPQ